MDKLLKHILPVYFILLSVNSFAQWQKDPQWDENMSEKDPVSTAKKTVDTIREPPSVTLHIEISGRIGGG